MPFDKSSLIPCPILRPSQQEFDDPISYLSTKHVKDLGRQYGIVKVVPPGDWKPPFSISSTFKFHTRIQKLSDLGISSRSRKFFIDNLNRYLRMSGVPQINSSFVCSRQTIHFYDLYLAFNKVFSDPTSIVLTEISAYQLAKLNSMFNVVPDCTTLITQYQTNVLPYAKFLSSNGDNFDFPEGDPEDADSCVICGKNHSPTTTLLCDNCDDSYHMKCLSPPLEEVPKGLWYCGKCLVGTGEYGFEENPEIRYTIEEFFRQCNEFENAFAAKYGVGQEPLSLDTIEQIFWSLIEEENSQIKVKYGADIHNSAPGEITGFPTLEYPVFDPHLTGPARTSYEGYAKHPWNLTRLPFANGSLLNHIDSEISGMTVPWIYVGSLLSTFCWHVEDHYTLSANYCHFGKTKKWYGIPSSHADKFESHMKSLAPDLFQRQPDLLHQLVTLISPSKLAKIGIPCVYADQNPNEFIITFPRVYHAGFNSGFNFNEAVNFTMDSWIDYGERSIRDYKLIKKENVFDHFRLLEKILESFINDPLSMWTHRKELVGKCVRSFENFLYKQMGLVRNLISDKLHKASVYEEPAGYTYNKERESRMASMKSGKRLKASKDDDDNLCDICRVAISYQYCDINNRNHRFGKWYNGRPKKKTSTVMTVNNLLTPVPSPSVADNKTGNWERACAIAKSESGDGLSNLQDSEEEQHRPTSCDQFEELIQQAKRRSEEEENEPGDVKRRRPSRRLEIKKESPQSEEESKPVRDSTKMSQMKKVQYSSLLHQLNQYDNVKLCLECTVQMCGEHGEKVPKGSQISFRREFDDMKKVLVTAKEKYRSLLHGE